jgi:hypothetical protein
MENQIVQCDGGYVQGEAWSDLAKSASTSIVRFDDDLRMALHGLEGPWRTREVVKGAGRDMARGRDMTVFVAVGQRGSYLTCQSPLLDAASYDELDTLILHVWRAFERSDG